VLTSIALIGSYVIYCSNSDSLHFAFIPMAPCGPREL